MEPIVATAIVGTGQQGNRELQTGTAIDQLATQLPASNPERRLLLIGGALAIYRQAGYRTEQAPEAPQPADPEQHPACSPLIAHLIGRLFDNKYDALLPEALHLLKQAKQRLPHELLPEALDYCSRHKEIRPAFIAASGKRGSWLSQYNPAWSWVTQFLSETAEGLPDDAETIWQEGTPGQRQEILRRIRAVDPAKAREWLMAVWKQEKADSRSALLDALSVGVNEDDEAFLEKVLDDKSEAVRSTAASLLIRIPTSALARRTLARGDAMLNFTGGTVSITLPAEIDDAWERDTAITKQNQPREGKGYWLNQVLSRIPLKHWQERFATTPTELIRAAGANEDWGQRIVESWSRTALLHPDSQWLTPLLEWQQQQFLKTRQFPQDLYNGLLSMLPQQEAENWILALLPGVGEQTANPWISMSTALKKPWSKTFGEAYLQTLRTMVRSLTHTQNSHWQEALEIAVTALPIDCFNTALEPWIMSESVSWQAQHCQQQIDLFSEKIRLRKQLIEEIKP